jgi:hypothetical protein
MPMAIFDPEKKRRADEYLNLLGGHVKIKRYLGGGTDGDVWETDRKTAIKVFGYENGYRNERDTYHRLADFGITEKIAGFWVPRIIDNDDRLMVVEMDMMQWPPYIIDFAKVKLNTSPDFSTEVLEDRDAQGIEHFGHHWPEVLVLLAELESYLIYYLDPRPGNITFPDME